MPPLANVLLIVLALAGGAWLTMLGAVLGTDAVAAFEVGDPCRGIAAARQGMTAAWIGLPLFVAGASLLARMLA